MDTNKKVMESLKIAIIDQAERTINLLNKAIDSQSFIIPNREPGRKICVQVREESKKFNLLLTRLQRKSQ